MNCATRLQQIKLVEQLEYRPPNEYKAHACDPRCCPVGEHSTSVWRFGPLVQPIVIGWRRIRKRGVFYIAPCGLSMKSIDEICRYLDVTKCQLLGVDNFCFERNVDCLREYVTDEQYVLSEVSWLQRLCYLWGLKTIDNNQFSGPVQWPRSKADTSHQRDERAISRQIHVCDSKPCASRFFIRLHRSSPLARSLWVRRRLQRQQQVSVLPIRIGWFYRLSIQKTQCLRWDGHLRMQCELPVFGRLLVSRSPAARKASFGSVYDGYVRLGRAMPKWFTAWRIYIMLFG